LLDINVATPNGVSNHLLIKMRPPDHEHKRDDTPPAKRPEDQKLEARSDGKPSAKKIAAKPPEKKNEAVKLK